jgi:Asp-tRNA(Asn)/Glu-tRNA(Gln) amidotransferase A subunit family amidase
MGPLHGIPVAVKDLFFTNGVATKGGLKVYANHVPKFDATAVERLSKAGAVLVGKLSLAKEREVDITATSAFPATLGRVTGGRVCRPAAPE